MARGGHANLGRAQQAKKDEFYTQRCDIERELVHYEHHFGGKVVLCNCDDWARSNFARYFADNFARLGLKRLICTGYHPTGPGSYAEFDGTKVEQHLLSGDGDFRSPECQAILERADIVVTNPPFSLFRPYLAQLSAASKKLLVIANINAITYKEVFSLIAQKQLWLGVNLGRGISGFIVPEHYALYGLEAKLNERGERIVATNNCLWLTNLDHEQRHAMLPLTKQYAGHEADYPCYDNCAAINVNKTKEIPCDYLGLMGVPITFLHKFNPAQFELIRFRKGDDGTDLKIAGKSTYFRILIRRTSFAGS